MSERGEWSLSSTLRAVGLVALVIVAAVVVYLAVTRDPEPPGATGDTSPAATADPSSSESVDPEAPPEVSDALRVDFSSTPELPATTGDGSVPLATYDSATAGSPLAVADGLLTHAAPSGKAGTGTLEAQLPGPVQKIGAVISFPKGNAGAARLVAWSSSFVAAGEDGQAEPSSGLRLEVEYGLWQLSVLDGSELVIAGDEYEPSEGALQQFEVYRSEDRAWVVDPAGSVTMVQNPAIAALAGPWASWQVSEATVREKPVGLQSIWAG